MFSKKKAPQFVVAASLALSAYTLSSPNYYYFASRKTTPQHVIMKYLMRGFSLSAFPSAIQAAIMSHFRQDPLWRAESHQKYALRYPSLHAKGYFSAYSITSELNAYRTYMHGAPYHERVNYV
jgi:hypothetical protein